MFNYLIFNYLYYISRNMLFDKSLTMPHWLDSHNTVAANISNYFPDSFDVWRKTTLIKD